MRRALALMVALGVGSLAPAEAKERPRRLSANPSAVIAAELAFAQLAQTRGQWTAFRATATEDAEMFAPQRVRAQQFLKGRADPPVAVRWQPHRVWMSCDGSYGVTRGAWQRAGSTGQFSTVWQRQRDNTFKWVLDLGDPVEQPLAAPEMIEAKVADCSAATPPTAAIPTASTEPRLGRSRDGTLRWESSVTPEGAHSFTVRLWNGSAYDEVLRIAGTPPAG